MIRSIWTPQRPTLWRQADLRERPIYLGEELPDTRPPRWQFRSRQNGEHRNAAQPPPRDQLFKIRARTAGHSSSADGSAGSLASRRSSSASQAASQSGSAGPSSRASTSATMSRRSPSGSSSTSCRSSCGARVTDRNLAGGPPTGNNGYAFRDSGRTVKTPTIDHRNPWPFRRLRAARKRQIEAGRLKAGRPLRTATRAAAGAVPGARRP